MRQIKLTTQIKSVAHERHAPPDVVEVRLTNKVAKVLSQASGCNFNEDGWFSPFTIYDRLGESMENYIPLMEAVGLERKDFLDLIQTLRALTSYAKKIGGYLTINQIYDKREKEYDSKYSNNEDDGGYQGA